VTKCQHYFCESCSLKNYKSDSKCFVCGQATDGVFNAARDLIKYLKSRPAMPEPEPNPEKTSEESQENFEVNSP